MSASPAVMPQGLTSGLGVYATNGSVTALKTRNHP